MPNLIPKRARPLVSAGRPGRAAHLRVARSIGIAFVSRCSGRRSRRSCAEQGVPLAIGSRSAATSSRAVPAVQILMVWTIVFGVTVLALAMVVSRAAPQDRHDVGGVHGRRRRRVRADDARLRGHPARVDHVLRQVPPVGHHDKFVFRAARTLILVHWPFNIDQQASATSSSSASTCVVLRPQPLLFVHVAEARHRARGREPRAAVEAARFGAPAARVVAPTPSTSPTRAVDAMATHRREPADAGLRRPTTSSKKSTPRTSPRRSSPSSSSTSTRPNASSAKAASTSARGNASTWSPSTPSPTPSTPNNPATTPATTSPSSSTKTSAPAAPCASTAAPPASSSSARSPNRLADGDPHTRTNRHGYAYGVRF